MLNMEQNDKSDFIEIINITKRFPGVLALDNVNFSIKKGEVHALLGENGAGKSTLIKILTGVFPPDAGHIQINQQITDIHNPHHAIDIGISAIYQDPSLIESLSVENNILLGHEPRRGVFIDQKELRKRARMTLDELGLDVDLSSKVSELSPGQKQLVAVAKALSVEARLLIMDEPTAALTNEEVRYLFDVIYQLRNQGISVIYVSHRMEEVFEIADRITVLRDGKYIGTRLTEETNYNELVRMIVGRDIEIEALERQLPRDEIALEVKNISLDEKFSNVSFSIRQGEIVALTGLVGSGRTDVARAIFGATPIDKGQILIFGKDYSLQTPRAAIQKSINMVPEDRKGQGIIASLTVQSNITLANLKNYSRYSLIQNSIENKAVDQHIQQLRILPPDPRRKVMHLSGGNQQKVVLAKVLDTKAKILILDEPTAGVDVGAKSEIRNLINKLADRGHAILLISSEIPEILALADRILTMKDGEVVGELSANEATSESIMHLAMTGDR